MLSGPSAPSFCFLFVPSLPPFIPVLSFLPHFCSSHLSFPLGPLGPSREKWFSFMLCFNSSGCAQGHFYFKGMKKDSASVKGQISGLVWHLLGGGGLVYGVGWEWTFLPSAVPDQVSLASSVTFLFPWILFRPVHYTVLEVIWSINQSINLWASPFYSGLTILIR